MMEAVSNKVEIHRSRMSDRLTNYTQSLSTVQLVFADKLQNVEARQAQLSNDRKNQPPDPSLKKEDILREVCMYRTELLDCFKRSYSGEDRRISYESLMKCYTDWNETLFPVLKKLKFKHDDTKWTGMVDIPLKLAGYFLLNGESYKALRCLRNITKLWPFHIEARVQLIKWMVHLGEWELLDKELEEFKDIRKQYKKERQKTERIDFFVDVAAKFASFCRAKKPKQRPELSLELLQLLAELERVKENTFQFAEKIVFLRTITFYLSKVDHPEKCVPDALHTLQAASYKAESILKNRLPGLSHSEQRFDFAGAADGGHGCLETCTAVAEFMEILKMLILEMFNTGMVRDASKMAEYGVKLALKLGFLYRIQQMFNLSAFVRKCQANDEALICLPILFDQIRSLYAWEITTCRTPVRSSSPSRCPSKSPSRQRSPARCFTPGRIGATLADTLAETFADLAVTTLPSKDSIHLISDKCSCETCYMYRNNNNFAMGYHFSVFINSTSKNIDGAMEKLRFNFVRIRELTIEREQLWLFGNKYVRPRPPISMSEIVCMAGMEWLRSLENEGKLYRTDTSKNDLRELMIALVYKSSNYSLVHTLCYWLSVKQLMRDDKAQRLCDKNSSSFDWMKPSSSGDSQLRFPSSSKNVVGAVRRRLSSWMLCGSSGDTESDYTSARMSSKNVPVVRFSQNASQDLDDLVTESVSEYRHYSHILYPSWRFPIATFIGRFAIDSCQAAMMWTESGMISTRAQSQYISGKIEGHCFSRPTTFMDHIKLIPRDFTVVQLATDTDGHLYLIKLHKERRPLIMPLLHCSKVMELHTSMKAFLAENDVTYGATATPAQKAEPNFIAEFWNRRRALESKLQTLVLNTEKCVFGALAPLLLPCMSLTPNSKKLVDSLMRESVSEFGRLDRITAEELVSLCTRITKGEWDALISRVSVFLRISETVAVKLKKCYARLNKDMNEMGMMNLESPLYTFLILPPELSSFPFESMQVFHKKCYVGRLPSIHSLIRQLITGPQMPRPVVVDNSYYVLDPENNLEATKTRITELLTQFPWTGVVGTVPSTAEVKEILENKDIFFYIGHGCGSNKLGRSTIKESRCKAVSVLMGCGSVHLEYDGWGLDGKCTVYDYAIANCPCVVGCLWMVTDGEIDKYFKALVNLCFAIDANTTLDRGAPRLRALLEGMSRAKEVVRLPYLTGAAVVAYGVPVVSSSAIRHPYATPIRLSVDLAT